MEALERSNPAMSSFPAIRLTTFQLDEWALYRDMRLKALADAPSAFCQTLSSAQQIPDEEWQARLVCDRPDSLNLPIKVWCGETVAGMAWGRINTDTPNIAYLFQMWVDPRFRRLGIGRQIIRFFLEWAKAQAATHAELGVTCGETAPYRLYQSFGFRPQGSPEPMRAGSDAQFQTMVLDLDCMAPEH
jgi:ribosomal protein S18 acetylase RimI-like enzyme